MRLHAEAAEVWQTLEQELDGPLDVHITGGLMVAETAEELQLLHEKRVIEEEAGLDVHVLEGEELRSFAPYLAEDLTGASFCEQEGHANPALAAPLFALRAAQRGAVIRTHAEVTGIDVEPSVAAGRFTVATSAGRIRAHRVVNAAGAWANEIAALAGLQLPIRSEGLHLNVTEPREHVLGPMVQHIGRRLTLKQTAERHVHHRRRLASATRAAAAALLHALGEHGRERRGRGASRAAARRRPHRPHLVRRDGVHRRPCAHRGRIAAVAGLQHADRDDRLHTQPADGAAARGDDGDRAKRDPARLRRRPRRSADRPLPEEAEMNREDVDWRGYWPACPTPFTADGAVDVESLRALVEWYVGQGMHGIFVNGTTGEWFSQSPEERRLVAETAIDQVAGRMKVVVGCTSLTAKEAIELGRDALAAGAAGIGSTPPPYCEDLSRRDRPLLPGHLGREWTGR